MGKIKIGKIVNTHGIHGHVKIVSESDNKDVYLKKGKSVFIETKREVLELKIKNAKEHKGAVLVLFEGVQNINEVEKYRNCFVSIDESDLIQPNEDEFYHKDLIGLQAELVDGRVLGYVTDILETGANDVLRIEGEYTVLIPFLTQFVPTVDLVNEKIVVTPIEGMIDDEV